MKGSGVKVPRKVYFYTREANGVTIAHAGREGRKRNALFSSSMIVSGDSCFTYESPLFGWMNEWVDRLIHGSWLSIAASYMQLG